MYDHLNNMLWAFDKTFPSSQETMIMYEFRKSQVCLFCRQLEFFLDLMKDLCDHFDVVLFFYEHL